MARFRANIPLQTNNINTMKNFTLLLALFFSLIITAQDHPGKRPELLLGKEVTIRDLEDDRYSDYRKTKGYERFYTQKGEKGVYEANDIYNTKYEALVSKTFTVTNVEPAKSRLGDDYHVITLESGDQVLYHSFYPKYPYYFIVKGGLDYPADFYCDDISEKPFLDTGLTDYIIEPYSGLSLTKTKGKELTKYLLYAGIVSPGALDKTKGISFTLDNGIKIGEAAFEPKVNVNSYGDYSYSGVIELSDKDLELLKSHIITHIQVGAFKKEVSYAGKKIHNALPCLMTK